MLNDASVAQVQAADPGQSTWLSANAGSGKTRVLIDRVARLLLQGTPPQRILCLTYTNAAASEMQNRLFARLGQWAMQPADDLRQALQDLGTPDADLAQARRLFARAIETPGGLRIQTIHSFCASLLRRFPLEAGVPPQFTEIDEHIRSVLIREILEEMADGSDYALISALGRMVGEHGFLKTVERIAGLRQDIVPHERQAVLQVLGLPPDETIAGLAKRALSGLGARWCEAAVERLMASGANDQRIGRALAAVDFENPDAATLQVLEDGFLTLTGTQRAKTPTKPIATADPALFETLIDLGAKLVDLRQRRITLESADDALLLSDFAGAFLPRFAEAKSRRGWLDFDDLIDRAERLLTDPSVAAWVLFRLDGGIDHILVDEAQDTGPKQWRVIELLTQEFTAGLGARGQGRTLFVVGDKKQSIYSFQGADVSGFDQRQQQFRSAFDGVGLPFASRELRHSFRSSPVILSLVDRMFGSDYPRAMGNDVGHVAFHDTLPGRIEVWPAIEKAGDTDGADGWLTPVDQVSDLAPVVVLADQVAAHITHMLASGAQVPLAKGGSRAARPGDFLILVRRRSGVFPQLLRACKAAGLPVAGADRLKLAEELAVQDLLALLSVLAMPEDDLSLATVLRSPLFGWSEAQLYDLAYGRSGYLWEALRHGQTPALAVINDLRDQADFMRPHDLLDRALTRHRGRVRLVTRLGEEVQEAIDALLAQSLAYEQVDVPSLDGFLTWMQGEDSTIKRQMGAAQDRIRIMTVHGAKGLESEIVILPDTNDRKPNTEKTILVDNHGLALPTAAEAVRSSKVAEMIAEKRARDEEEALRLLYVALTRSRSQLIVAAAGEAGDTSWHGLVRQALGDLGAKDDAAGRLTLQSHDWPLPQKAAGHLPDLALLETIPAWADTPLPPPKPRRAALTPSKLGGEKVLAGGRDADPDAIRRGTALHLLLQHLPGQSPAHWPTLAKALVPDDGLRATVLPRAMALIGDARLTEVFGPGSLAEVPVAGLLFGQAAEGAIDRLVVLPAQVLAVDFKSNRQAPQRAEDVPESILRQMGAYAGLLAQAYPDRPVQTAVLWTETGLLMPLSDEIVRAALSRSTTDGGAPLDLGVDGP